MCTTYLLLGIAGEMALGESFGVPLPRGRSAWSPRASTATPAIPALWGVNLFVLGTFLIAPSLLALVTVALNFAGYHLKVRAEEE